MPNSMPKQAKQVLGRYSGSITLPEIAYNLVRYKFKKVDVFGHTVRVPVKYADEFQEKIDSLHVMLEITDVRYTVESNHTMIEVAIYNRKLPEACLTINFHFYSGFAVIVGKKYKEGSRLRRISVNRPLYKAQFLEEIHEESKKFHEAIDFAVKIGL